MGRDRAGGVGVAERLSESAARSWTGWEEGSTCAWTVGAAATPCPASPWEAQPDAHQPSSFCLPRPGPDPCEHVPDCGDQPRPGQRAGAGGHGPRDHQDIRQHGHCGRPGCGSGDVGTVTHSHVMASFSSLLQSFLHVCRGAIKWN